MVIFEKVCKSYPKELFRDSIPALRDVSFALANKKTLGLIGANGAGKSTSIRLLMDFIRPSSGSISLFGMPASDLGIRNKIGYLPETASFPGNLSMLNLISFTCATCGLDKKTKNQRTESLLQELGLWEVRHIPLRNYSKGMQQRANFVLALLNDPQLLVLDEPMSGLDPIGRNQIISLIQRLKVEGKTILFCSHILSDVDRLVDQLLVLHKGRCLFEGSPAAFLAAEGQSNVETAYLALIERFEHVS